jgi:hypothetical protein
MNIIKKYVSLVVVALVILCGMEAVAFPLNQADDIVKKLGQTPYEMNTNTTNLTITYTSGFFGGIAIKNVGEYNATNIQFRFNITYKGLFNTTNIPGGGICYSLTPGESFKMYWVGVMIFHVSLRAFIFWWRCPQGFGPITIETTASADNALPVTTTTEGIILLHFVIIK